MASVIKLKRSLTPGSVPGSLEAGELAINIPDKKLFSSNGSSVFNVSGDQYNLASSAVDSGAAVTLTVDNELLSNDSIELLGGTGITVTRNANSSITLASASVAGSVDTAALQDGAVTAAKIAAAGLSTNTLANFAVTTAKLDNASITSEKIATDAVTANTIADNAVTLGTHTTGNYVASIAGTTNEIEVTGSGSETAAVTVGLPDNVTISDNLIVSENLTVSGNTTISGNLDVNGTLTYINSTTVTIGDNMLKLANTNTSDSVDLGFYSRFNDGAEKFTGLVRDATDGAYTLFTDLASEPDQTINFGSATTATLNAVIDGGTY